jgi:hypothetical protein
VEDLIVMALVLAAILVAAAGLLVICRLFKGRT